MGREAFSVERDNVRSEKLLLLMCGYQPGVFVSGTKLCQVIQWDGALRIAQNRFKRIRWDVIIFTRPMSRERVKSQERSRVSDVFLIINI